MYHKSGSVNTALTSFLGAVLFCVILQNKFGICFELVYSGTQNIFACAVFQTISYNKNKQQFDEKLGNSHICRKHFFLDEL